MLIRPKHTGPLCGYTIAYILDNLKILHVCWFTSTSLQWYLIQTCCVCYTLPTPRSSTVPIATGGFFADERDKIQHEFCQDLGSCTDDQDFKMKGVNGYKFP